MKIAHSEINCAVICFRFISAVDFSELYMFLEKKMKQGYSYRRIWEVSYPIFLGLLAQNIINVTDTAFLGRVGEVELGASAMGGLFYICVFTIAFGFSTGSQIMIARRNGEREFTEIGPIMMQGCAFLLALSVLLFGSTKALAPAIMRFIVSSDAIYTASLSYLSWRIFGFLFSGLNVMFRAFYVGITRTKVLTLGSIIMATVNVWLDYGLIFGRLGLPQWGLEGAAIASVIAEACCTLFFLLFSRLGLDYKKYGLNRFRIADWRLLERVLNISSFTMLQYFLSMSTFFTFFIAVEKLGEAPLAIANIVRSIYIVLLIPVQSLSTCANTLVSNLIGEGGIRNVMHLLWRISRMSFMIIVGCVFLVALFPQAILSIYTNEVSLIVEAVPSLYTILVAMLVASLAMTYFGGISGTGNTQAALYIEGGTLIIYTAYVLITGLWLKIPVEWCFACEVIYYALMFAASVVYLKKVKWQNKKI